MTTTPTPATDRQVQYLASLWEQIARGAIAQDRDNGPEAALVFRERADDLLTGRISLNKAQASSLIESAKNTISHYRRQVATTSNASAPISQIGAGLYIKDDTIYKVILSNQGRLYAKRLVPGGSRGRFEYAAGAIRTLTPEDALTAERAAEWGRQARPGHDGAIRVYCACCGAELDNEESRDRGIGPVCYRRYF
jgi:hypothetical protein